MAAAKGPVLALRGTGSAEKMLKNVKIELWNEYEEIGNYVAIESLAKAVGDKDTEKLAREYRKQEERMADFLSKLLPQLGKAVATEEIPAAQRRSSNGRAATSRSRSSRSSSSRSKASSSRASSSSRSKASSSRSKPASSSRSGGSSTARRSTSTRSRAKRS